MKLLLDTHAALWWLDGDPRFSRAAERQMTNGENHVLLSAVVPWEVAVKRALGKLDVPGDVAAPLVQSGVMPLPIALDHAAAVEGLPGHHADPFDRLLIAQAQIEGAAIVTRDAAFADYNVPIVW